MQVLMEPLVVQAEVQLLFTVVHKVVETLEDLPQLKVTLVELVVEMDITAQVAAVVLVL